MSDLQNKIDALVTAINKEIEYKGVTWYDGQYPPLSAKNLNISEDALRSLLTVFNESQEGGIIQQIVNILQDEIIKTDNNLNNISTLSNHITSIDTSIENLDDSVSTNSESIKNVNIRFDSLEKTVTLHDSKITELESDVSILESNINNIENNLEGIVGETVIKDQDFVRLYCGSSRELVD